MHIVKQPVTLHKLVNNHQVLDVSDVFPRGKYVGRSVYSILIENPSYIVWVSDNNKFALKHRVVEAAKSFCKERSNAYYTAEDFDYDEQHELDLIYNDNWF